MSYADENSLLNYQLVCKRWNETIIDYVWRKKAETKTGHKFSLNTVLDWKDFYLICAKNLFGRNLLKNHSGEEEFKHWILVQNDFAAWNYVGDTDSNDSDDNIDGISDEESDGGEDSDRNIQINGEAESSSSEIDGDSANHKDHESSDDNESSHSNRDNENMNRNDNGNDTDNDTDNGNLNVIEIDSENEHDSNSDRENDSTSDSDDDINDSNYDTNDDGDYLQANYMGGWIVECPPYGAPLPPPQPEFEDKEHCFVTTYYDCYKEQVIDLIKEGFSTKILDQEPSIEINEWYCCRWDCEALYNMRVRLLNQSHETIDEFVFKDILEGPRLNIWFNVKHEFKNYGKGLRKIRFVDGGRDRRFWAGHFGSKMAGAYVKAKIPEGL